MISIYAPRVGSDYNYSLSYDQQQISIHAPRVGSDLTCTVESLSAANFNPRSPCGERPRSALTPLPPLYFNPRSPCGERPSRLFSMLTGT